MHFYADKTLNIQSRLISSTTANQQHKNVMHKHNAQCTAVPAVVKRAERMYSFWGSRTTTSFLGYVEWVKYEVKRRKRVVRGKKYF